MLCRTVSFSISVAPSGVMGLAPGVSNVALIVALGDSPSVGASFFNFRCKGALRSWMGVCTRLSCPKSGGAREKSEKIYLRSFMPYTSALLALWLGYAGRRSQLRCSALLFICITRLLFNLLSLLRARMPWERSPNAGTGSSPARLRRAPRGL